MLNIKYQLLSVLNDVIHSRRALL